MKYNMFFSLPVLAAALLPMAACSEDSPVLTDKDLDNTEVYLDTDEGMSQHIYYKP